MNQIRLLSLWNYKLTRMYSFILNQWMCKTFRIIPIGSLEYEPKPETDGITRMNAYYIRVFFTTGGRGQNSNTIFFVEGWQRGCFKFTGCFFFFSVNFYICRDQGKWTWPVIAGCFCGVSTKSLAIFFWNGMAFFTFKVNCFASYYELFASCMVRFFKNVLFILTDRFAKFDNEIKL